MHIIFDPHMAASFNTLTPTPPPTTSYDGNTALYSNYIHQSYTGK